MRKLAVVVVLLLAGIVGFAFYRGWFRVSTDNTNHMPSATITMDKDKIHDDEQRAKETVQGSGQKAKEKAAEGKPTVTITADKAKLHDDEQRAKETVQGSGQEAKEKTAEVADKVKESERPR